MADNTLRRAGEGNVPITLDGEERVLTPNYNAAHTISLQTGGISGAIAKVMNLDVGTIVSVISLGLGYTAERRPPKDLAEKIWRTGLTDDTGALAERCVLYLRILASGGRMPSDEKDTMEVAHEKVDPQ